MRRNDHMLVEVVIEWTLLAFCLEDQLNRGWNTKLLLEYFVQGRDRQELLRDVNNEMEKVAGKYE